MKKFFNLDNPFFQFMEKLADCFIVNFLVVLCSLPIFTIGAAVTACHKVMQNMLMDNEQPVLKSYFRAFVSNFKQATILWLITLLVLAFLIGDFILVHIFFDGNIAFLFYFIFGAVSIILLGAVSFAYPLLVRYENSLKNHLKNAIILAISNLPRTIIMLVVNAIPILLAIVDLKVFVFELFVLGFIGISILVCVEVLLVRPVFRKLEKTP